MWPIKVSRSDHVTIWQSFWQNDDFDWPAVLRTKLSFVIYAVIGRIICFDRVGTFAQH